MMLSVLAWLSRRGDWLIRYISALLALLLIFFSGYVLWDTLYTHRTAFSSWDVSKFRPNIEEGEELNFDELLAINKDLRGWLTVYKTNIDYPVVQGTDDLEYVNKDIYGNFALYGTIYLAASNKGDFSDPYNIIYGHHMDNGAMFGDIDNFVDVDYLKKHQKGILMTLDRVYDLHFFACVKSDAYDPMYYSLTTKTQDDLPELLDYIAKHAKSFTDIDVTDVRRLLVLSTCADATSYGRTLIFAYMTPQGGWLTTDDVDVNVSPEDSSKPIKTADQPTLDDNSLSNDSIKPYSTANFWALLNLICLVLTVYTFLPLHILRAKLSRPRRMKKVNAIAADTKTKYRLKHFSGKMILGLVCEALLSVGALIIFFNTENLTLPMTIIDSWTPFMIIFFVAALLVDMTLLRYRTKTTKTETGESQASDKSTETENI